MDTIDIFIEKFKAQFELLEDHEMVLPTTNFKEMDSWDSLTAIMVLNMIEEEYDVALDGDIIIQTKSVSDLYGLVAKSKGN